MSRQWNHKIFEVTDGDFEALALEIFRFQYDNNPVYKAYTDALRVDPLDVHRILQIPFLPVQVFKSQEVKTTFFTPRALFESSGTTATIPGRHSVKDLALYKESFTKGFEAFYGPVKDWCIIGLLPAYLERQNSSLVYMVNELTRASGHPQSGFYLDEYEKLFQVLKGLEKEKQKTWLIGVSFALLDFAERFSLPLQYTSVIETGGMKGRREEMLRQELHAVLQSAFKVPAIHSEYGMTELLSQAYSKGRGVFNSPPWMKIFARDDEDPFLISETGTGAANIIDLANIWSCSFIATDDVCRIHDDKSFEVLGRIDGSDLRGCSLMVV